MNLKTINIISVIIPITVLVLFQIKLPGDFSYLPHIYAPINAMVFILLISSFIAIKKGNILLHKRLMLTSIVLSILFLLMYILYHATTAETKFPRTGGVLYFYYALLISHILLSVITIPLVLRSLFYGLNGEIEKHKKFAKIAFPLWLYVAFSGVLVYIMIAPYYGY